MHSKLKHTFFTKYTSDRLILLFERVNVAEVSTAEAIASAPKGLIQPCCFLYGVLQSCLALIRQSRNSLSPQTAFHELNGVSLAYVLMAAFWMQCLLA